MVVKEYEMTISFKIDEVDFEVIINFFDCLYQVGIIQKMDEDQLDL